MKKRILCMVLIFGVLVCALSMTVLAEESSVDAFSLTCHDQTGYIGEEAEYYHLNQAVISYSFQPEETSETVTMVSDNPDVATVEYDSEHDSWYAHYHKLGTAVITATTESGLTDTCTITVKEIESVQINQPFTVTIQPNDKVHYQFEVDKSETYYSLYSENGEGLLRIDQGRPPFYGTGVDTQLLYVGTYVLTAYNKTDEPKTYTLCIKESVPAEKFVFEQDVYYGYPGDKVLTKGELYPLWHIPENAVLSSSDENIAYYTGTYRVTLASPGTATITATTSGGGVTRCTVIVRDYEAIQLGESKTITLPLRDEKRFTFTPEKDGEYYFYTPMEENDSVGNFRFFDLYIRCDGKFVSENISMPGYEAVSCVMEAGKTYILSARYSILGDSEFTGTVSLDELPKLFHSAQNIEKEDPYKQFSISGTQGWGTSQYFYFRDLESTIFLRYNEVKSMDESIVKVSEYEFDANKIQLEFLKSGSTTICYTHSDGTVHHIPVIVELPEYGFYTTPYASAETYLDSFTVTKESNVIYFVATQGLKIKDFVLGDGFPQGSAIEPSPDGSYIKITIGDFAGTNVHAWVNWSDETDQYKLSIKFSSNTGCTTHTWNAGEETTAPTCTTDGTKAFTCTVCGETKIETLPAIGHSYTDGKCTVCGAADPDYAAPTPTPTPTPDVPDTAENPFTDVADADYFYRPVLWAVDNNITGGLGEGIFGPNEGCTRGQVVTFLWAANGKPEPNTTVNPFNDVSESDYYYKAVLWAVENNITGGVGEGLFGPNATCTRGQIVTFLWAANGKPAVEGESRFTDVTASDWFLNPVLWAAENNVTGGIGEGMFGPNNTCTRGQVVTFLYKVYNK